MFVPNITLPCCFKITRHNVEPEYNEKEIKKDPAGLSDISEAGIRQLPKKRHAGDQQGTGSAENPETKKGQNN